MGHFWTEGHSYNCQLLFDCPNIWHEVDFKVLLVWAQSFDHFKLSLLWCCASTRSLAVSGQGPEQLHLEWSRISSFCSALELSFRYSILALTTTLVLLQHLEFDIWQDFVFLFPVRQDCPSECRPCEYISTVSRAGWGARPTKSSTNLTQPVPYVFIHHTAMGECHNQESCSERIREIQDFHMDNRGVYICQLTPDQRLWSTRRACVGSRNTKKYRWYCLIRTNKTKRKSFELGKFRIIYACWLTLQR